MRRLVACGMVSEGFLILSVWELVEATLPLGQWYLLLWVDTRASRPSDGSQSVPTFVFTSSGSLGWMAGNLLMQFTLKTPVVPTNNMLLRSTNPKWIPASQRSSYSRLCRVAAICIYMTASPNHDKVRRYGYPPAQDTRRPDATGCSLGSVQMLCRTLSCKDPHCVGAEAVSHSVMLLTCMDQCSHRPVNLPDRSFDNRILLRFRNATSFEDHINWPHCCSQFVELCVASMN